MFENDICWCANSIEDKCKYKDCFRHISNLKKSEKGRIIFTTAHLKETIDCPYYKEKE